VFEISNDTWAPGPPSSPDLPNRSHAHPAPDSPEADDANVWLDDVARIARAHLITWRLLLGRRCAELELLAPAIEATARLMRDAAERATFGPP
jgi:hypothetical protein